MNNEQLIIVEIRDCNTGDTVGLTSIIIEAWMDETDINLEASTEVAIWASDRGRNATELAWSYNQ